MIIQLLQILSGPNIRRKEIVVGGPDGQPTEQTFGFVAAGHFIQVTPGTGAWLVRSHQGRAFTDEQFKQYVERERDAAVASGNKRWTAPMPYRLEEEPNAKDVQDTLQTLDSIGGSA